MTQLVIYGEYLGMMSLRVLLQRNLDVRQTRPRFIPPTYLLPRYRDYTASTRRGGRAQNRGVVRQVPLTVALLRPPETPIRGLRHTRVISSETGDRYSPHICAK